MIRSLTAYLISPVLALTGLRFSKRYRWGRSIWHKAVYMAIDTIKANNIANDLRG